MVRGSYYRNTRCSLVEAICDDCSQEKLFVTDDYNDEWEIWEVDMCGEESECLICGRMCSSKD